MVDTPIKVSYRWNAGELLLMNGLHMKYSVPGRKFRRSVKVVAILFLGMGVSLLCALMLSPEKSNSGIWGVMAVLIGLGFLLGMPRLMRRAVIKSYEKKSDRDMMVTYELSRNGLSYKSEVSSSETLWCAVLRVFRTRDGFLIYLSENQIFWLPVHGFQDPAEADRFAEMAKAGVKDYTNLAG